MSDGRSAVRARPLLIVNGDDWGLSAATTDAILKCVEAGAVTSTTAMVHMEDSTRAAALAVERGVEVGLHLNLTEPFSSSTVPDSTRARQTRAVRLFSGWRRSVFAYDPTVRGLVRDCVRDQLDAFRQAYGRDPSHIDGHHHVHATPTVLLSGALPAGLKLRRTFTFERGERPPVNRVYRQLLNLAIARRHPGTDRFTHFGLFVQSRRRGATSPPANLAIEVMTHPAWDGERLELLGESWPELVSGFTLGGYDQL